MTDTRQLLTAKFATPWHANQTLKPLVMYAHEDTIRAMDIEAAKTGGGYVALQPDGGVLFDFRPGNGADPVPATTITNVKWTPYCGPPAQART